jgi:hypothetical protein
MANSLATLQIFGERDWPGRSGACLAARISADLAEFSSKRKDCVWRDAEHRARNAQGPHSTEIVEEPISFEY